MNFKLFILLLITTISVAGFSQEKKKVDSISFLNEVVVTTKLNQKNINTAKTVESILIDKQNANGCNSMYSLLNTASGVYMVDMGNEQHAMSIRLPMNYSPLYNYLENGIPIRPVGIFNNNELLELNRFSLHKIEVVKGPYSGGYGAQSVGASINFIQNNFDNATKQISLQSNGYGQFEVLYQTKAMLGKTNFLFNVNHAQRDIDEEYHFNYSKQAWGFRFERALNKNNYLTFQSNWMNYKGDQRDGYDSVNFYKKNLPSFDRFSDRFTWAIRTTLEWKHHFTEKNVLNITLFNRVVNEDQNPFYLISYVAPYTGQITNDAFASYGINVSHSYTNKNNKIQWNQALYVDFTPNNKYTSKLINVNKINGVNVSFVATDSFLTHYKANLINVAQSSTVNYYANKNIIISAGVRWDLLQYKFINYLDSTASSGTPSGNNHFFNINPEVSFLYKINNNQSMYAQFSSGFTPPTLSNLYRGVKTPILTAAKYYSTEIGYKLITKKMNLQLSLYNMYGVDEFVSVIRATGVDVVNAGKTNHKGIELKWLYSNKNIECNYNASLSQHTFKEYNDYGVTYDGNTMNGAPSYLHYTNISYTFQQLHQLKLVFEWNKVGAYKINASNTNDYKGYDLFNIKSTISINNFFINMGVNNLFNKVYATNADGTYGIRYYPGIQRTLQIGLAYKF